MKKVLVTYLICFICAQAMAQGNTPILKATLTNGTSKTLTSKIGDKIISVQQSIGQMGNIRVARNKDVTVQQGFLNFYRIAEQKVETIQKVNVMSPIVFPNPFSDVININFLQEITGQVTVGIFDMTGRRVFKKSYAPSQSIQEYLEFLQDALYIATISVDDYEWEMKVIKKGN